MTTRNTHKLNLSTNNFQALIDHYLLSDLGQVQTFTIAEYSALTYLETGRRITLIVQPQGVDLHNHRSNRRRPHPNR